MSLVGTVAVFPCNLAQEAAVLGRGKRIDDSLDNLDAVGDHVGLDIIVLVEALEVGRSFAIGGGIEGDSVVCGCDKGLDLDRTFEGYASTSSDHRSLVSIRRLSEQTDHPNGNWNRGWEVGHSISLTCYSQECNVHKAT